MENKRNKWKNIFKQWKEAYITSIFKNTSERIIWESSLLRQMLRRWSDGIGARWRLRKGVVKNKS